jgi:flagellar P-ring protein precursor FlgI
MTNPINFLSQVEQLEVQPDMPATVVIDSRSGLVLFGGDVTIKPAVVSIEGVTVRIKEYATQAIEYPTQPGNTVNPPQNPVLIKDERRNLNPIKGTTVAQLVNSLNEIGLTANQIIAVLEALKKAGALNAQIKVD